MRILLVHNYYQNADGKLGEGLVFQGERGLLIHNGHRVSTYTRDNDDIRTYRLRDKATLAMRTIWAWDSHSDIQALLKKERPDVVHFHNTFPLISPAAYYACRNEGVPIVQSLHNGRLFCPSSNFFRNNQICEKCLGKTIPWPAVLHRCYRESRSQTGAVVAMAAIHNTLKSWHQLVNRYIVFTRFFKNKCVEGGLPHDKIVIKPHYVENQQTKGGDGKYALFIGRLVPGKGVITLLNAWEQLRAIPLKIRGEGPLLPHVRDFVSNSLYIELVPRPDRKGLFELIRQARFLVWPSELYESFGLVAAEAFACGVPVIASAIPTMEEMVSDGRTGLTFRAGNAKDLAAKVQWAWDHPEQMRAMGREARREYESKYTPELNYSQLIAIYKSVLEPAPRDVVDENKRLGCEVTL